MLVKPQPIDSSDPRVVELRELTELLGPARERLVAKQHRLVRELHADGATPGQLAEWIDRSDKRIFQIIADPPKAAASPKPGSPARRNEEAGNDRDPGPGST